MTSNTTWAHTDASFKPTNPSISEEQGWNRGNTPQNNPSNWPQLGGDKEPEQLSEMMNRVKIQNQTEESSWVNSQADLTNTTNSWGKSSPIDGSSATPNQTSSGGWGAPLGWGQHPPTTVDNGTAVWGNSTALQDQGIGWGSTANTTTSNTPTTGWGVSEISTASSSQTPPQEVTSLVSVASSKSLNHSISLNEASTTLSSTETSSTITESAIEDKSPKVANNTESSQVTTISSEAAAPSTAPETSDPVQQYVNSHEGWGKTPIQQNTSWDISENPFAMSRSLNQANNGTEAWGKATAGQLPLAGNWGSENVNKKHSTSHWTGGANNFSGHNNWGGGNHSYNQNPNYNNNWVDQRPNQPGGNDCWPDPVNHAGGWNVVQGMNPKSNWGNPMIPDNNRNWNMSQNSRYAQPNSWNTNAPPMENWNRPMDMNMSQRRPVDDGTGAWGDPSSYQEVHMWNNSRQGQIDLPPTVSNPNTPKGWGMPTNNPGPKNWNDSNPSRPMGDNGTAAWRNKHQQLDKGGDWMKHVDNNQVWNQSSKPSSGSNWGQSNEYGDSSVPSWGQPKGNYPKGNLDFQVSMNRGMNRGMRTPLSQQANNVVLHPPPSPQLNGQFHQGVMNGIFPSTALHPSIMTSQHIQNLVQLLNKHGELQQLQGRLQVISQNKLNGSNVRAHEMELKRTIQQVYQQIELLRNAIMQSTLSKSPTNNLNKPGSDLSRLRHPSILNPKSGSNSLPTIPVRLPGGGGDGWKSSGKVESKMPGYGDSMHPGYLIPQDSAPSDQKMIESQMAAKLESNIEHPIKGGMLNSQSPLADIGPPEFTPGVPWPGLRAIDPETDPNITPGSAAQIKSISVVNKVSDADQLLSKRERGALSESSNNSTNGSGFLANSISSPGEHPTEVFSQVSNPGMHNNSSDRWSNQGCWLVLTNFTNEVDVDAVKEMCGLYGTVIAFQAHNPIKNMALVRYSTQEEADAAKKALHIYRVGQTMLLASVANDQEVENYHSASNNGTWAVPTANRFATSTSGFVPQQPNHVIQPRAAPPERMIPPVGSYMWNNMSTNPAPPVAWPNSTQPNVPWSGGQAGEETSRLTSPLHSLLPENLLGSEII